MLRAKRGGFIYRGDLYIRAWELQSESRQRAHQHQRNLCISVSSFGDDTSVARTPLRIQVSSFPPTFHLPFTALPMTSLNPSSA